MNLFLFLNFAFLSSNAFRASGPIDFVEQVYSVVPAVLNQQFLIYSFKPSLNVRKFKEWEDEINNKIQHEKYLDAIIPCKKMEQAAIDIDSEYWQYLSYFYRGVITKYLKDYKTSQTYFLKIIGLKNIPFSEDKERMFRLFHYTGEVYKKLNAFPEAITYYKKCLVFKDKIGDKKALVSAYVGLGILYSQQHNFVNARECYLNGLNIAKGISDYISSIIFNNLGNDEYFRGNFSKAIGYYIQSIQLSEKAADYTSLAFSYNNLGNIYTYELKDYYKAMEYYTKSLDLEKKAGNKIGIALELNNFGNVYTAQSKFAEAEKSFMTALQIFKAYKNSDGIAKALENLGALYSKKRNYKKAIAIFLQCIDIRKMKNDEINLANVYNSLGALYYYQQESRKSLQFYTKALELARLKMDKSLIRRIYGGMHEVYAQLGQYDKAYEYFTYYSDLKDTLLNATISKQIIEIGEKYEKNKIEQQVAYENLQIKSKTLQRNGILVIFTLAILIFSSIVFFIFQKRKNEKLLYNRNSKIKDQEIKKLIQDSEIRSMISMDEGQEAERQRISRELHDRVGSLLSLVKLNLSEYEEGDDPVIKENLILLNNVYQEVQNISHDFHSGLINHFGLKVALTDLKKTIESHNSIRFSLLFHQEEFSISKEVEEVVFRVLQELIANTLKHAEANNLDIQLTTMEDGSLSIVVEDDGKGFDPLSKNLKGIGLKNIGFRLSSIGGSMEISSSSGNGACFIIRIPISAKDDKT